MWAGLVKTLVEKRPELEGRPDAASYVVESPTSGETYEWGRLECGCGTSTSSAGSAFSLEVISEGGDGERVGCRHLRAPRGWRSLVVGEAVWGRRRIVLERGIRRGLRHLINKWGWAQDIAM